MCSGVACVQCLLFESAEVDGRNISGLTRELLRDELFPLVGLDSTEAERYAEICDLVDRLSGATTAVVEKYLAGELSAAEAAEALQRDALMEHPEALLAYVDRYRGYALAYTFGRDRILSSLAERTRSLGDGWGFLNQLMTSQEHFEDPTPQEPR